MASAILSLVSLTTQTVHMAAMAVAVTRRMINLKGRPCPKCNRKGLHFADHPHAFGWKDYDRVVCRFCKERFKIKERKDVKDTQGQNL